MIPLSASELDVVEKMVVVFVVAWALVAIWVGLRG